MTPLRHIQRRIKRRILHDFIKSIQMSGAGGVMGVCAPALYSLADEYLDHGHVAPAWAHPREVFGHSEGTIDDWRGEVRLGPVMRDLL